MVETLVGMALLGSVAVAALSGVATASKATYVSDKRATAEALARSQMEYVKSQSYEDLSTPGSHEYRLVSVPATFTLQVQWTAIDPSTGQALPSGQDNGLQRITATVTRDGRTVISLEDYKVNR